MNKYIIIGLLVFSFTFAVPQQKPAVDSVIQIATVILGTALVVKYTPEIVRDIKSLFNKKMKESKIWTN